MATSEKRFTGTRIVHPDQTSEYWTEERMKSARPLKMPTQTKSVPPAKPEMTGAKPGSRPPSHHAGNIVRPDVGEHLAALVDYHLVLQYPYSVCGKLFLTTAQEGPTWATASIIAPNILLTAGHAVFQSGQWHTNFMFCPSFPLRANTDPLHQFTPNYIGAPDAWTDDADFTHDFAMLWCDSAPGDQLGYLGSVWNLTQPGGSREWLALGYPQTPNPPFTQAGGWMGSCFGPSGGTVLNGTFWLEYFNMGPGSSGGPWITNYGSNGFSYANSVMSFDENGVINSGPYFGDDFADLYNWISDPNNR